jgi:hypothetical protein
MAGAEHNYDTYYLYIQEGSIEVKYPFSTSLTKTPLALVVERKKIAALNTVGRKYEEYGCHCTE